MKSVLVYTSCMVVTTMATAAFYIFPTSALNFEVVKKAQ